MRRTSTLGINGSRSLLPSFVSGRVVRQISYRDMSAKELQNQQQNAAVVRWIDAYRQYGHYEAQLDPLRRRWRNVQNVLDPSIYGLMDMSAKVALSGLATLPGSTGKVSLSDIEAHLKQSYCSTIGAEFMHCSPEEAVWLAEHVESVSSKNNGLSSAERVRLFELLQDCEFFDHFLELKYRTTKRYGGEGAESMMIAVNRALERSAQKDCAGVVIGMPHRGRLNLLTMLLQYPASDVIRKIRGFSEAPKSCPDATGDVMSHIAQSVDMAYDGKSVHVSLIHNPSHLEAVNPVSLGKTRAALDRFRRESSNPKGAAPFCIQLHGDGAFSGQGVVPESLALSKLPLYETGGTLHIVVNNQIGYTADETRGRSTWYATDICKGFDIPVLHVNADDPEAVAKCTDIAVRYREKFHADIAIDLIGYRRHGHNELDEPRLTQPQMYKVIDEHPSVVALYGDKLQKDGILKQTDIDERREELRKKLEAENNDATSARPGVAYLSPKSNWADYEVPQDITLLPPTGVKSDRLRSYAKMAADVPEGFPVHRAIERMQRQRAEQLTEGSVDWPTAEAMAFGSILDDGYDVRLSGQDVGRGTFSQRHTLVYSQATNEAVNSLNYWLANSRPVATAKEGNIRPVGNFYAADSALSEFATMGFEFGYAMHNPNALVIWEAQFGDFANGAQIVIDNFLSSTEDKWWRQNGLVLQLPHGMEGTGPEHCSSKIERFLQLCNGSSMSLDHPYNRNPNMQLVFPSTPASYFHALRRQVVTRYRKPLIIAGPKSLLRLEQARSPIDEMKDGTYFSPVIGDKSIPSDRRRAVKDVVLCSGRAYYDVIEWREAKKRTADMAVVRIEEYSPFPFGWLQQELNTYPVDARLTYYQEEQENQGAWNYSRPRLALLGRSARYVGRGPLSSVAVGIGSLHKAEIAKLEAELFS